VSRLTVRRRRERPVESPGKYRYSPVYCIDTLGAEPPRRSEIMKRNPQANAAVILLLTGSVPALSQDDARAQSAPSVETTISAPSGVRAEILKNLAVLEDHYVRLAEAVPAAKYSWRPGDGVRSISEVYLHASFANYNLPRYLGTEPPAGLDLARLEQSTTDKAKIVERLKHSFAHLRGAIERVGDGDLEQNVKWIDNTDITHRGVMIIILEHLGEHFGQSVAYARMNGVVPPWTEERLRQQHSKPKR
jgi:uncharacterized damage-inducible protein DinB